MKTNTKSFDDLPLWMMIAGVTGMLIGCSLTMPLLYLWIVGTVGILTVLFATFAIGGSLMSSGQLFDAVIGYQVIEGGFQLVGVIFLALAGASSND